MLDCVKYTVIRQCMCFYARKRNWSECYMYLHVCACSLCVCVHVSFVVLFVLPKLASCMHTCTYGVSYNRKKWSQSKHLTWTNICSLCKFCVSCCSQTFANTCAVSLYLAYSVSTCVYRTLLLKICWACFHVSWLLIPKNFFGRFFLLKCLNCHVIYISVL